MKKNGKSIFVIIVYPVSFESFHVFVFLIIRL